MNATTLEKGVADFVAAKLSGAGLDVAVLTGQGAGEIPPLDPVVIAAVEDVEHEVGPLYTATVSILAVTPELTGSLADHRALTQLVGDMFGKDQAANQAELAAAVFEASGLCVAGTFVMESSGGQMEGRWFNGPVVKFGIYHPH